MTTVEESDSTSTLDLIGVNHEDGDMVLIAGDPTGDHVKETFRVHRAIICLPSAVFKDLAKNSHPDERIDGCPVIRCYDSASDIRILLSVLYNGLAILQENHLTLDIALSILLLSNKYCMDGLRNGIVRLLQEDWPLNYSDYLTRRTRFRNPGCSVIESMKLIHVAQRCEVWELLPAAFYEVAATRVQDWNKEELETAQRCLSQTDLCRILTGKERSAQRLEPFARWDENNWRITSPYLWKRDPTAASITIVEARSKSQVIKPCTPGRVFCPGVPATLKNKIADHFFAGKSPVTALRDLQPTDFVSCQPCVDWLFKMVFENKRQEMWEKIPADFGLPGISPNQYSRRIF